MFKYLFLPLFFSLSFTANAQMFDELKTKQKELNPSDVKVYLEGSVGAEFMSNSFYIFVPDYTSPITNFTTKAHIENEFAGEFGFPVSIKAMYKLSKRVNIGIATSYASYSGTYIDLTTFNNNDVTLSMLTYYGRFEYMASNSLRNSFMMSLNLGSFLPMGPATQQNIVPSYFTALGLGYLFKITGHFQILGEMPFSYRTYTDLQNPSYPCYAFSFAINVGARFGF